MKDIMSGQAIIKFNIPHCNLEGESFRNITHVKCDSLGIKTEKEIEARKTEFPEITLADILDVLFDFTPLSSNKIFATYNNVLVEIRKAKQEKKDHILIDREDLEAFMKLFDKGVQGKPELNRKCAFVCECLDVSLANCIKK